MKKAVIAILLSFCFLTFAGCSRSGAVEAKGTVTRDTKYNAAEISLTPDEFKNAGFDLGDSCDILFGNGYSIPDVPYFNGYYVKNDEPVIVAYPGFSYIRVTYNNSGIWDTAGLKDNESVTIRLREKSKYSAVQEVLGQVYSFEYSDYDSAEEFCNFRELSGGKIKKGLLFRGASPVDNSRGRAAYTDRLISENGIVFVIDLADSEENMKEYMSDKSFDSAYAADLYKNGQTLLLDMSSSYQSEEYCQKVAAGLKAMLDSDGPVYIHCMEGKDRTGFVCMLLEALAGASYEEMCCDYMKTYENYFSVSPEDTPEKYDAVVELYFDSFVSYLHKTEDLNELKNADYVQDAVDYLIAGGMAEEDTILLRQFISE